MGKGACLVFQVKRYAYIIHICSCWCSILVNPKENTSVSIIGKPYHGSSHDLVAEEEHLGSRSRGGGVRRAEPPDAGEFSKVCKKVSFRKVQKMNYFSLSYTKFNNPCLTYSLVWTKHTNCKEIVEKI